MRHAFLCAALLGVALAPARGPGATAAADFDRPLRGPVLRHFEPPESPRGPGHRGIDLGASPGTLVRAAADGVVSFAGAVGGALFVSIEHPGGVRTTYSFLSAVLVRRGAAVGQGDPIARTGAGHPGAAEPHLHFGMRAGDEYRDPDPALVAGFRRNLWRVVRLSP